MIAILIALIVLAVFATVLVILSGEYESFSAHVLGALCALGTGVGLIYYAFAGWDYIAADYKADIINREYGTAYTQAEVYWASDVINTIRELDRNRIELNGDLLERKQ